MAFSLGARFPPPIKTANLLDPGAYQNTNPPLLRVNKVPFLSQSVRGSGIEAKIWTHSLHYTDKPTRISNCTSFMSKVPRFPYDAFSETDKEAFICQCCSENPCECSSEEDKKEIICQGKFPRKLYKGLTPKLNIGGGLSAPSKKDHGFKVLPNGTKIRLFKNIIEESPPFYDARVVESTAFYHGCKWSKWTSQRDQTQLDGGPGPASYTCEKEPSFDALCAEKVRASKRLTSKQYRFIEMVQRRNVLERRPGPADYSPNYFKGNEMKRSGAKAGRFASNNYEVKPGPTEYFLKRDFDKVNPPQILSNAKVADPAFFGIKAERFKTRLEEGPSPASYNPCYRQSRSNYCNMAPFGSTTRRFKDEIIGDSEADVELIPGLISEDSTLKDSSDNYDTKSLPTWGFKSKTIRIKPLLKKHNEPSPADLAQSNVEVRRSQQLQFSCPFYSSEGRFQPWFNWIPVHGKDKTPGPAYYCIDKPKCPPAVNCGPLYRTRRFPVVAFQTPAPNAYRTDRGIETILATYNTKLKENIANKHEFHWSPHIEPKVLDIDAQEAILLKKSIALLEVNDIFDCKGSTNKKSVPPTTTSKKTKLLRCFLKTRKIPRY